MKIKYERLKAHQQYVDLNGFVLPGATTVLGVKNKPALVNWAWKEGRAGRDLGKVKQQAFDVGSCFHFMAECFVNGNDPDLDCFSKEDIDRAETCFIKFLDFWHGGEFKHVTSELQLVHSLAGYGGTLDEVALDAEGRTTLIDYKTAKAIYPEYYAQLAAYGELWNHADLELHDGNPTVRDMPVTNIERRVIVRVGKEDVGDFEVCEVPEEKAKDYLEEFHACLTLYRLDRRNRERWER